jgi:ubiquinone/menaquinone biosynthesis C-methylase UbiE
MLNLSVVPPGPCDIDFGWYEMIRAELLRRTVGQADQVLDVGCGPGNAILMLSGQIGEGIGVDVSVDDLDRATRARLDQGIANVRFQCADVRSLPFPAERFDVVLLLGDVLAYLDPREGHEGAIGELWRVLKQGGIALHDSMNWDWEYRWPYPTTDVAFTRSAEGEYTLNRLRRTASGRETSREYEVLPGTPLHRWIREQAWPVSPQGANAWLEAREGTPIPRRWLRFKGVSRYRHYRAPDLRRLYRRAGFSPVEVYAYGQTYDIAAKAGLLDRMEPLQLRLAMAEAELAHTLRLGSGPWLFLVAGKE